MGCRLSPWSGRRLRVGWATPGVLLLVVAGAAGAQEPPPFQAPQGAALGGAVAEERPGAGRVTGPGDPAGVATIAPPEPLVEPEGPAADDPAAPGPALPADEARATLTLAECYALALERSETLAINQALIEAAEGQFLQAMGAALPDVSFLYSVFRQDSNESGSGITASSLRPHKPEGKFVASQTLFAGFKEFAAMAASGAEREGLRLDTTRAEQILLLDVTEAFYAIQEAEEELVVLGGIGQAVEQRIHELEGRRALGRSRHAEVASARAQLKLNEAEREAVRGIVLTARHLLQFLTGVELVGSLIEQPAVPDDVEELRTALARVRTRPDVQAAAANARAARRAVWVQRAGHFPTVSVDANYYTARVGFQEDIDWDVTLDVDVPIFSGGEVLGRVREAQAEARNAAFVQSEVERRAVLDVRQAYETWFSALARRGALEQAVAAAEENHRAQLEDYRMNLVGNLDVLEALQDLGARRRDLTQAVFAVKRAYWRWHVATGRGLP